jgi:hypothetical protein
MKVFGNGRYANVAATLALVISLGGTSYAAVTITGKDIKNGTIKHADLGSSSVTSKNVRNGSLLARDFAAGQIPAGAKGPKGDKGDTGAAGAQGPAGPGARWALVKRDGTILAQSGGISVANMFDGGYYLDFGSSVEGQGIVVSSAYLSTDSQNTAAPTAEVCGGGGDLVDCEATATNDRRHVYVQTADPDGTIAGHAFTIMVLPKP